MSSLKPCPDCGGEATTTICNEAGCRKCGKWEPTIVLWNALPRPSEKAREIARLVREQAAFANYAGHSTTSDILDRLASRIESIPSTGEVPGETKEKLADYAHEAWAGWMRHLFELSDEVCDGTVRIPSGLVDRWKRQVRTPYADLPEEEKESDRKEADRMLTIIHGAPERECEECKALRSAMDRNAAQSRKALESLADMNSAMHARLEVMEDDLRAAYDESGRLTEENELLKARAEKAEAERDAWKRKAYTPDALTVLELHRSIDGRADESLSDAVWRLKTERDQLRERVTELEAENYDLVLTNSKSLRQHTTSARKSLQMAVEIKGKGWQSQALEHVLECLGAILDRMEGTSR
jgi:hypothetical protein